MKTANKELAKEVADRHRDEISKSLKGRRLSQESSGFPL
jgi:hypothetical protein